MSLFYVIFVVALFGISDGANQYSNPHFTGNRSVITQLMQWKFEDIALECEHFLGPYGYGGVQLSPVGEHYVGSDRIMWSDLYAPVSYKIATRSGNETQFKDMVQRCNKVGVRIYVDIVLNHMTGPQKGSGTAGSHFDGETKQFPGVPFGPSDFHGHESCPTNDLEIHDYTNTEQLRNCNLGYLRDLKQSSEHVRSAQAEFLNQMIDFGVAGFRVDAAMCMWPADLEAIYSKLHNLNTAHFPTGSRPFIYHEVIFFGGGHLKASEYTNKLGRIIDFHYYRELAEVVRGHKVAKELKTLGQTWDVVSEDVLVMVDSHDLQRGHNGQLGVNLNFFEGKLLKIATAFMLAWPFGVTRVMSSFSWNQKIENGHDVNDWYGPPSDSRGNIVSVHAAADLTCNKEWICEHRWREIFNMVSLRNIAGSEPVQNWWDNGHSQIAFSRGNKAFVVFNMEHGTGLSHHFQTGLPAGIYCNLVNGNLLGGKCSGSSITVNGSGTANITIDANAEDPFVAIHVGARH